MNILPALVSRVALATAFFFIATLMRADTYDHSGTDGTLSDGHWINRTIGSTPPTFGNPGSGDDAYFYGSTITASGGSVHLLSGGNFVANGDVNAINVGEVNLSGSGMLTVQSIVTDVNGFGPILQVSGAGLMAQNADGVTNVTAGGTVMAASCAGTNGCGFYDGAGTSLTITGLGGPDRAAFANGGQLIANAGLQTFVLQLASGSTAQASAMTDCQAVVDGANSNLMVTGDFSMNSQSMNVKNGGAATVSGNLTQLQGAPLFVMDGGSSLTVGQDLLQNTGSDTDIRIYNGGTVRVQRDLVETRGQVQLDGSGSALTVDRDFSGHGGFVDLSAGATLSSNGQLSLDGGMDLDGNIIGGGGQWTGTGTTIDCAGVIFVGADIGTFSLGITDGATVKTAASIIGLNAGSSGIVSLSGANTLWEVQSIGFSVGQRGMGKFDISVGAHLLVDSGTFSIGLESGSHGNMTVDGNGSLINATGVLVSLGKLAGSVGVLNLTDQASMLLANNTFIGDGGSGSMTASSGSHISISGASTRFGIGNEAGSTGSVSIQGTDSSLTVAGPTIVGVAGSGFLGAGDGAQIMLNNSFGLKVGGVAGSTGNVVLDGEHTTLTTQFLAVGDSGMGRMTISNGAELDATGSRADVGAATGSDGAVLVTGTGSLLSIGTMFPLSIGGAGTGTLSVLAGAEYFSTATGIAVAVKSGSTGSILVSDAGSSLSVPSIGFGDLPFPPLPAEGGAGTITVQNSGVMRISNSLVIRASTANPSVIIDNGQIGVGTGAFGPVGSLRVSEGGVLAGSPQAIRGQVIVGLGGTLSPGNSPGIFAIDGNYTQDAGGTFQAEIGGSDPGTGYDQINVTGTASVDGNLVVRLTNGFTPTVGQTFRILSATSASGAFVSISEPSQAEISLATDATGIIATITSVVAGAPVISSPTTGNTATGTPFTYQIAATNNPTVFGAADLPAGLSVDQSTGLITGTPTTTGVFIVQINANNPAGSGQANLILSIDNETRLAPSRLQNISTRLKVQTGENVLIGGFIITGTVPKQVIARAIGPSLGDAGVTGFLADPTLELHKPDGSIITNDNWRDTQEAEIIATTVAPTNDLESAIVATLAPGNYTAVIAGKNGGTGAGLVEIFDLTATDASPLANISTRGFVSTGDDAMIGGFILGEGGGGNTAVALRAIGPSLSAAGVADALLDPILEVHNSNGAIIAANDNWMDDPNKQRLIDNGLAPTSDAESALVATLGPGSYTAIVRGVGNTTGVALVEAYTLP